MASLFLVIPNYPDPQAPGATFTGYASIGSLNADFRNGRGRITLDVYREQAAMAAAAQPADTLIIQDGGRIVRGGPQRGATFPDMATIQSDQAAAWGALWTYLLGKAITLDGLTGATPQQSA